MAEVGVSGFRAGFDPDHAVAGILHLDDFLLFDGLIEAGPSSAAVEFGLGGKERFSGNDVDVDALRLVVPVFVVEWRFGSAFAGDLILHRCELVAEIFLAV